MPGAVLDGMSELEAVKALGYTQVLWDNEGEPAAMDKDWAELSPAERAGAGALGWDRKSWDAGDADRPSPAAWAAAMKKDWRDLAARGTHGALESGAYRVRYGDLQTPRSVAADCVRPRAPSWMVSAG